MKKLISLLLFLAMITAVLLYATGYFHGEQVSPGTLPAPESIATPAETATADRVDVQVVEEAVGTVSSRTVVVVSAQVQARVLEVHTDAGASVRVGDLLIVLDDRELKARRGQAADGLRQTLAAQRSAVQSKAKAQAALKLATSHQGRIDQLVKAMAATPEELERAETALLQAAASLAESDAAIASAAANIARAKQALEEADVALGHTKILSPISGVVSMKSVEPGDLAWSGKALLEILDPADLRLEAQVREGLIAGIQRADEYDISIPAADLRLKGTVSEICPAADPLSRTFRVRVEFEPTPGIHPGMFGRMRIPRGKREVVRVPRAAVQPIGQLEAILVKDGGAWSRRFVTTGRLLPEDGIEVLSGLRGGETIGLGEAD